MSHENSCPTADHLHSNGLLHDIIRLGVGKKSRSLLLQHMESAAAQQLSCPGG